MVPSIRILLTLLILIAALVETKPALADRVVPDSTVKNGVVIRSASSSDSAPLGMLEPGKSLELVRAIPDWYEVRLEGGRTGFVSKRWTGVVPAATAAEAAIRFAVHFLDVGTGDSAVLDVGTAEAIIDGGDSVTVLSAYVQRTKIIDGPIELVVVTHGDTDHWNGLRRLLGFDGKLASNTKVLEYWDPGYDRDCNPFNQAGRRNYLNFVGDMKTRVPSTSFRRPLQTHHAPAVVSGRPQPFKVQSMPGVTFTLLHSDAAPSGGDCSYTINNASIVMMVEVGGIRILFTGDANGKERKEASPGTPGHVEAKLLTLEKEHPGTLKADVIKVPHHGSETASTQAFVDAVNPRFVIFSSSTKHHLPRETTVKRYENGERVILRTDKTPANNQDHIICTTVDNEFTCNYEAVLNE